METWSALLARADEETLQTLLGADLVEILLAIEPELARAKRMRDLIIETMSPESLVCHSFSWRLVVNLLRPSEAEQMCVNLGISKSNPYDDLGRMELKEGSDIWRQVLNEFGVYPRIAALAPQEDDVMLVQAAYPLFAHQRSAVSKLNRILSDESARVLLHMPTGSGKTRTAMHAVCQHLIQNEKSVVLWIANSEELCNQAADEFLSAWRQLGNRETKLGRFWGSSNLDVESIKDGLVIAGIQKLNSRIASGTFMLDLGDRCSLTVFDEAHQVIAPTYKRVVDILLSRNIPAKFLGLSATPGRTWNEIDKDLELSDFFGRRKVILEIPGYSNPVDYLIDNGYLARVNFDNLNVGNTIAASDLEKIQNAFEIPSSVLEKLGLNTQRNLLIIDRLMQLQAHHERILYFAPSVENAGLISRVLHARGVNSNVVTGDTPSRERAEIIADFKSLESGSKVLCNFGILTTGFDAPRTSAALIARPTTSLVLYSQMVGRAIRGIRAGGNEFATVVTAVDSGLPGFGDVGEAFLNWEDVWE